MMTFQFERQTNHKPAKPKEPQAKRQDKTSQDKTRQGIDGKCYILGFKFDYIHIGLVLFSVMV